MLSQSPIVHNQLSHHVLHSIPKVYAQGSHELRNRIRSVHSGKKLNPDSPMYLAARFCPKDPANYTLSCRLEAAPKPNVAGVLFRRSLAHGPPVAAESAARLSNNLQCCLQLCASTYRLPSHGRTRTLTVTRLPLGGVQSQGKKHSKHTGLPTSNPKRQVLATTQSREYNYHIPNQTTCSSKSLHYTGANLMITGPSSPISSLVRSLQSAQGHQ